MKQTTIPICRECQTGHKVVESIYEHYGEWYCGICKKWFGNGKKNHKARYDDETNNHN